MGACQSRGSLGTLGKSRDHVRTRGVLCEGLVRGDLAESQEGQDLVRHRDAAERARFGVLGLEGLGIGMEFCPSGSPPPKLMQSNRKSVIASFKPRCLISVQC